MKQRSSAGFGKGDRGPEPCDPNEPERAQPDGTAAGGFLATDRFPCRDAWGLFFPRVHGSLSDRSASRPVETTPGHA